MNFSKLKSGLKWFSITLVSIVTGYFILAYVLSSITVNKNPEQGDIPVYILTTGVHTDVILPLKSLGHDWSQDVKFEHTASQSDDFKYVAFGWGDKGFYLETPNWEDLKASVALKAMSGLSSTAMHTTFYKDPVVGKNCKQILLTSAQYKNLTHYINHSLQRDSDGNLIHIETDANYGKNDCFYEATGSYSLFKTCNSWANGALKSANQTACLWTPFDDPIFNLYK
jgi:uncharacterized protein (TIGR02117 family)